MKKNVPIINVLIDALLIACGVFAIVCSVPSSFGILFEIETLALVVVPVALMLSAVLNKSRRPLVPILLVLLAAAAYVLIDRGSVTSGARVVWYAVMRPPSRIFTFLQAPSAPTDVEFPAICVTAFMIAFSAVFAVLIALALTKSRTALPGLLIPLPALFFSLLYTDRVPEAYVLILLAVYLGGVLLGRGAWRGAKNNGWLVRAVSVLLAVCSALLPLLLSPQSSFKPIPYEERQRMLGEQTERIKDKLLSLISTNPSEYDLSTAKDRNLSDAKVFSMASSYEGTFLLRTHSYGKYNKNTFLAAPEYAGAWRSAQALGATQTGEKEKISISSAYSNERIVPYAFVKDDRIKVDESFIRSAGRTAYVWTYMPELRFSPVRSSVDENLYYAFAVEQYTLPSDAQKYALLDILEDEGVLERFIELRELDHYEAALAVADHVRNSGEYTLTPGSTPPGRDLIEYFLTESHAGYCVHFASSTTALLQALDIPARYVIGYRVEVEKADEWENVPEKASHAWAEVYLKGVGWIPIESTASYPDYAAYVPEKRTEVEPTAVPSFTFVPRDSFDPIMPTRRPSATPRPTRAPEPTPTAAPGAQQARGSGGAGSAASPLWLITIPAAGLIYAAACITIRRIRKRRFEQEDPNAAVLCMLRYLHRLERFGVPPEPNAKELAEEAAFSDHPMRQRQLELQERVRTVQMTALKEKPLKRFLVRFILPLL